MVADTGNRQFQLFCVTPGVFPLQRFTNSRLMDAQIAVAKTAVKIVYRRYLTGKRLYIFPAQESIEIGIKCHDIAALRIFLGNSLTQFPDDFIAFINTKHRFHSFQTTQFDDPHSQILIIVGLNNRHIFNKPLS